MVWNPLAPDGSKSVKQNESILQSNTSYTETTLGNNSSDQEPSAGPPIVHTYDHFWNIGEDEDGHHRQVQMKKYEDNYAGAPTDPNLNEQMAGAFFVKDSTGIAGSIDPQPFFRNLPFAVPPAADDVGVMQLLGIRAMALFNNVDGNVAQTLTYSHNVASVTRQATGRFSVVYTNSLPSSNYLVLGGGMQATDNSTFSPLSGSVSSGASVAARKNTTGMIFLTHVGSTLTNQLQAWFICFGG